MGVQLIGDMTRRLHDKYKNSPEHLRVLKALLLFDFECNCLWPKNFTIHLISPNAEIVKALLLELNKLPRHITCNNDSIMVELF